MKLAFLGVTLRQTSKVLALVGAFMATGCNGVLGLDALEPGCVEGQGQCLSDGTPRTCNAFGTWENQAACGTGQKCDQGACVAECSLGEKRCSDKTPQVCTTLGTWLDQTPCGAGTLCANGECVPECSAAIDPPTCEGKAPRVCNASGAWEVLAECQDGCDKGKCTCTPGFKGCSNGTNTPQLCSTNGVWENVSTGACMGKTCSGGECVGVCAPNEKYCTGNTPNVCNALGEYEPSVACAAGSLCQGGACIEACIPGDKRCSPDLKTRQICDETTKTWQDDPAGPCVHQTCDPTTTKCIGVCAPDETRCKDSNTQQQCGSGGQWQGGEVACGIGCLVDRCAVCEANDPPRCYDNTPQTCGASGQWVGDSPCVDQTCEAGICKGECVAGEKQCVSNSRRTCDPNGYWQATVDCTGQTCFEGACLGVCKPMDKQCSDNTPQSCNAQGQWADGTVCMSKTCQAGACIGECAQGKKRCLGETPQACDGSGVWVNNGSPCGNGTHCNGGLCVEECTPGDLRCIGDVPQTCNATGSWESNETCPACVECDPNAGVCESMATPGAQCGDPTAISAGYYHSCALLPEGRVKCWGRNDSGELGLGDQQTRGFGPNHMGDNLPAVDLGTGVKAIGIAAGTFHTCALLSNEKVKCWGGNGSGQLGLGDKNARGTGPNQMGDKLLAVDLGTGVTAKAIAAGYSHTCALLSDGAIKCWGSGLLLGLGTTEDHGSAPNEMGNNLPAVDLGTGVTATAITVGEIHTCALLSDGRVKCWGGNGVGQLGLGDQQDRGHQPNQMGDKLPAVNLGAGLKAKAISAGHAHTCALLSDDTVKCWGINDAGQLGLDDAQNRGDGLNEMGDDLPTVNLGVGVKPSAIVGGYKHTCALLTNGKVKCWGKNDDGQLGLGDTQTRGDGPNEMGNLPSVDLGTSVETSSVTAGFAHTCVLLVGGHLKCWGNNYNGQLGLDDPFYRGNAVNQMGNNLPPVDL